MSPPSAAQDRPDGPAPDAGAPGSGDEERPPPPRPGSLADAAACLLGSRAPVSTLVRVLDEALGGGLHPGRLYLVTVTGGAGGDGRPGAGGGLLAAGAVRAALFRDAGAVLYAAFGPSARDIAARVMAGELRVGYQALREGRLEGADRAEVAELSAGPEAARLLIEDRPGTGAGELARLAGGLEGLRLVVVDGLQAVPGLRGPAHDAEAVDGPGRELRRLARDLDVPVLAVAEAGDGEGLRVALAPDVVVALTFAADDAGYNAGYSARRDRVRVTECDLGLQTEVVIRTDLPRARLIGPGFDVHRVFGSDEGRLVVDALTDAAQGLQEAPEGLPELLLKRLGQLCRGMPKDISGLEFGDMPHEAQQAVLEEWAARPALPDTERGRGLGAALDAFYAHADAHGYDPEAEVPREPCTRPRTRRR
ncbi:DnaB-like helicase C-terminal domain-containing protein [Streptomyces europaeiscabiei]|uniref:DnaB-like helicase C-terminal domain-containing protein n=1 Tax=Streptomyces europaeiscabiei TaxID=146819 RepID=UPI0038F7EFCF